MEPMMKRFLTLVLSVVSFAGPFAVAPLFARASFAAEVTAPQAAPISWDVYLLAGQSNMDGRGKASELNDEQREVIKQASIFYRNPPAATETWKPLAPGYSIAPGYRGTLPSPTFGPEIGFAKSMIGANPQAHLALIKGSKGGTSLSKDWNPGVKDQPDTQGPCYRNFMETVSLALKLLVPADENSGTGNAHGVGSKVTLRGVLWHQGESDSGSTAEVYRQRLATFITRLREDLGQPHLPIVIGEVFDNGRRNSVRSAQRAIAETMPGVALASAEDLKTSDAGTHFDSSSQLILGQRMAEAMLKLLNEKKEPAH
jgi:iduronate 2-sulfatase